jgi:hypothetical protein
MHLRQTRNPGSGLSRILGIDLIAVEQRTPHPRRLTRGNIPGPIAHQHRIQQIQVQLMKLLCLIEDKIFFL